MTKKFGDTCKYIRNGEDMNAIVLGARIIDGVEHLTVCYPNKEVAGQMLTSGNVAKATLVDFDVKPMAEGANRGWYQPEAQWKKYAANLENAYRVDHPNLSHIATSDPGVALPGTEGTENAAHETKQYADGSSATGPAPLPNLSPDEQKAKNQLDGYIQNPNIAKDTQGIGIDRKPSTETPAHEQKANEAAGEEIHVPVPAGDHEKAGEPGALIKDGTETTGSGPQPEDPEKADTIH